MLDSIKKVINSCITKPLYMRDMRNKGVFISNEARIFGYKGIEFGNKSWIYPNSTIACSSLGFYDSFSMAAQGAIHIGRNSSIHSGAILATYNGVIKLGNDVSVNPGTIIYGHGGVTIGDKTRIAACCVLVAANHNFDQLDIPIMEQGLSMKGIDIEGNVWIGARVVVLDGVHIGQGSVIAAGSVVTKNIAPFTVVAGVPARKIRSRYNIHT